MGRSGLGSLGIAVLLCGGCYGGLDRSSLAAGDDGADDGTGADDDDGVDDGVDEGGVDEGANPDELPAPNTRFFRLTHGQWENTVRDLFFLDDITGLSSELRPDAASSGYIFANNAAAAEVDDALWSGYQRAASSVATLVVVTDPTLMDGIVPVAGDAEAFVREFGRRVFRRALTDEEVNVYLDAFGAAPDYYVDSVGFEAGVRLTIESMLQSPFFIYRTEDSKTEQNGVIPLDDFEVASRMSYFLWDSTPDDELLDVAEAGMLDTLEGVAEQAARMLDDDRAVAAINQFHSSLHNVDHFEVASPNPTIYPNAPEGLGALAQQEHAAFVRDVIFEQGGSYQDLLTSSEVFVNQDTAPLYGLDPASFGPEFVKASADATRRRGIFTQLGFLVSNATGAQPDPIHRGVFIAERVLCIDIPAPPNDVPDFPTADGETNRQAIESLTEEPGTNCAGCHTTTINPLGWPFENFDSTGAWRDTDNGLDVDASSTIALGGVEVAVNDAIDLIDAIAGAVETHRCYANHWVQFANGRPAVVEDQPLAARLAEMSASDASVKETLVELVTSRPFRTRAVEELGS